VVCVCVLAFLFTCDGDSGCLYAPNYFASFLVFSFLLFMSVCVCVYVCVCVCRRGMVQGCSFSICCVWQTLEPRRSYQGSSAGSWRLGLATLISHPRIRVLGLATLISHLQDKSRCSLLVRGQRAM